MVTTESRLLRVYAKAGSIAWMTNPKKIQLVNHTLTTSQQLSLARMLFPTLSLIKLALLSSAHPPQEALSTSPYLMPKASYTLAQSCLKNPPFLI